jgi:hypothetical protein
MLGNCDFNSSQNLDMMLPVCIRYIFSIAQVSFENNNSTDPCAIYMICARVYTHDALMYVQWRYYPVFYGDRCRKLYKVW